MTALSQLRLVCGKCGGKDIEARLVYSEEELQGSLRGAEQGER